jgi:hypothetical protein
LRPPGAIRSVGGGLLSDNNTARPKNLIANLSFLERLLLNYVHFKNPETNLTFREQIDQETKKNNTMDIFEQWAEIKEQEGLERGIERTTRKFVENLLKDSTFPVEKIASLTNVSVEFVTEVKEELR